MKLSKTFLLVVGAGLIATIAVVLGLSNSRRSEEKANLEEQLAASQASLQSISREALIAQRTDLLAQLDDTTPGLEAIESQLQPVTGAMVSSAVFDAARKYGLTVGELTSADPANEQLEGVTLSALSTTVEVKGNASDIIGFIRELNDLLKTGAVKSIEMSIPDTTANITPARSGDNTTAKVELAVYAYEGKR